MADILNYAGFEKSVRRVLGLESDDTDSLSSEDIHDLVFITQAEAYIKSKLPDWATYTGSNLEYLRLATIYYLAHLIAKDGNIVVGGLSKITDGDASVSYATPFTAQGREQSIPQLLFSKCWFFIYTLLGSYSNRAYMTTGLPDTDVITGDDQ